MNSCFSFSVYILRERKKETSSFDRHFGSRTINSNESNQCIISNRHVQTDNNLNKNFVAAFEHTFSKLMLQYACYFEKEKKTRREKYKITEIILTRRNVLTKEEQQHTW